MRKIIWKLEVKEKRKQMKQEIEKHLNKGNIVFLFNGYSGNYKFENIENLQQCNHLTGLDQFVIGYGSTYRYEGESEKKRIRYNMCCDDSDGFPYRGDNVTIFLTTSSYKIACMGIASHKQWYDTFINKTEEFVNERLKQLGYKPTEY